MRPFVLAALIGVTSTAPALAHLTGEPAHDGAHGGQLVLIALAVGLGCAAVGRYVAARKARPAPTKRGHK